MALIREPDGVDFVVAECVSDRQTLLETADWINAYRRDHGQSADLEEAMEIIRRTSQHWRR